MQVIYTLNTKNDEHEQFVARLKSTHGEDLDGILSDCTRKLQQCEGKLSIEKEVAEKKAICLGESLVSMQKERNQLLEEQV